MSNDIESSGRLVMLGELSRQIDGRLNEAILQSALDSQGYRRSRDWVRTQLRKMEELGAVRLTEAAGMLVAAITRAGEEHYERRSNIDGIAHPARGD